MRSRLFLAFALVIFVALGSVLVVANLTAENQVGQYLGKRSSEESDLLLNDLESFYNQNAGWQGVSSVFELTGIEDESFNDIEQDITTQESSLSETPETILTATSTQTTQPSVAVPTFIQSTPEPGQGKGPGQGPGKDSGNPQETSTQDMVDSQLEPQISLASLEATSTVESVTKPGNSGFGRGQSFGRSGYLLADTTGEVIYSSKVEEIGSQLPESELEDAIVINRAGIPVGYLISSGEYPGFPQNFESQLVSRIQKATLIAALASGAIAALLAIILSSMILRPVKALSSAAKNLSEGDLSQRVKLKGKNELVDLGNTFNQMAEKLQAEERQRKAMTADIAHELRTPLAVQRANLEAIQDGVYPLTLDALIPIFDQNRLLTRLVDDLRTLAMADSGELTLNIRATDFVALTNDVIKRFEIPLSSSNITIKLLVNNKIPNLMIDPDRIDQILHNLLQNAQRYSNPGTIIEMTIQQEGQMALLKIRDHGPGIPEEELERIFDRFYRTDKSREREKGGTGLGLSIARKLAQTHGGDLTAKNHPEGGALFTLSLPMK